MIGLLQRVSTASVSVDEQTVAKIDQGLLVLIGVEQGDEQLNADKLLERLLNYRIFSDADGKMNLSLRDIKGGLLLVPQFTLAADTAKGRRPSFHQAASPELGQTLFTYMCEQADQGHSEVGQGIFGADMQVALINDGPVTFWLNG